MRPTRHALIITVSVLGTAGVAVGLGFAASNASSVSPGYAYYSWVP